MSFFMQITLVIVIIISTGVVFFRKWLRLDLVPEHGARERFLMGTNVNSGTELGIDISGTQCLIIAPFCAGARALVFGHRA